MASTKLDIYNWALSIVGARASLDNPNQPGREMEVCDLWYPIVLDKVLRAAPWPSCRLEARLARLPADPVPGGFAFAYSFPDGMLRARHLTDFSPFIVGLLNPVTNAILTNSDRAVMVYTFRQANVGMWDSDLAMAVAHALASYICAPINGDMDRINYALQTANMAIIEARENAANQDMYRLDTLPEWFDQRGYGGTAQHTRFVAPYGQLLTAGAVK